MVAKIAISEKKNCKHKSQTTQYLTGKKIMRENNIGPIKVLSSCFQETVTCLKDAYITWCFKNNMEKF